MTLALIAGCAGESDGPHALGVIAIAETHASTGGTATGTIATAFLPDADAAAPTCAREVAGCLLPETADCGGTCGDREYCAFDAGCDPVCLRICDAACDADEECYFPTPDEPACRTRQSFDAGAITIAGTTTPVTLFPPYSFDGTDDGSLFAEGATLTASAAGATGAGFTAFEQDFTATRLVRSEPPLHELGLLDVFGDGDVPVRWAAGEDDITIAAIVTGTDGRVTALTCEASDREGSFDLPRAAIDAALDGAGLDRMTIAITRVRTRTVRGIATTGELAGAEIQPSGWLELSTVSTEVTAFEGCGGGEQVCGEVCVDVSSNGQHCGECGNDCPGSDGCISSTCSGPTSCNSCVNGASTGGGTCAALYNGCTADAECNALRACLNACTTAQCQQDCANAHPDGIDPYNDWGYCICDDACSLECYDAC